MQESSSHAALEAVKELFSGDGQSKKGRKGQNEVLPNFACCIFEQLDSVCCYVGLDPASSRSLSEIDYKPNIDESSTSIGLS